jgi:hypothetical protein
LLLAGGFLTPDLFAQDLVEDRTKVAQTGMQFLSVSLDPRAASMADAVTAHMQGSISMLYNPAGMAYQEQSVDVAVGQNRWITDIVYNFGTVSFRPGNGEFGIIGASLVSVDYGQMLGTIRYGGNDQGYIDTGDIGLSAVAAGLGYSRALSNQFSVGGNVKYVRQSLGSAVMDLSSGGGPGTEHELQKGTAAFDLGILYRTGFRSLNFAVNIRNFAGELRYAQANFELPLTFRIGLSVDMMDFTSANQDMHSFLLSVDATHPRAYSEQIKVGGEYTFMKILSLRAGYIYPTDDQGLNLGLGLHQSFGDTRIGADYGYSQFNLLGNVHRLGLSFSL